MQVEVVRGTQAVALLQSDRFRAGWTDLWERCPWASAFQSPGYVLSWYDVYRALYEPLLLLSTEGAGRPTGLMTLAVSMNDGQVQPAGGVQAEYSCWICAPESGSAFPASALATVSDVIGNGGLRVGMLPPATPLQWLDGARVRGRCLLQSYRRPLMKFGDGRDIHRSLNKHQNRKKLKALGKLGEMSFRRLTSAEELEPLLDTIICHHDVRHVALRGSAPFHNDALKREFTLALARVPGLLHVTVLSFGETLAGAHIGACGRREIELGLTAYNPLLARFSPGKHLVLLLAQKLKDEGFEQLDLTTGGEAYKERHANAWDQVQALTIFPSANRRRLGATKAWLGNTSKSLLYRAHVSPTTVRSLAREMSIASLPGTVARALKSRTGKNRPRLIMARYLSGKLGEPACAVRRNVVEDLLAYHPSRGMPSRRQLAYTSHRPRPWSSIARSRCGYASAAMSRFQIAPRMGQK